MTWILHLLRQISLSLEFSCFVICKYSVVIAWGYVLSIHSVDSSLPFFWKKIFFFNFIVQRLSVPYFVSLTDTPTKYISDFLSCSLLNTVFLSHFFSNISCSNFFFYLFFCLFFVLIFIFLWHFCKASLLSPFQLFLIFESRTIYLWGRQWWGGSRPCSKVIFHDILWHRISSINVAISLTFLQCISWKQRYHS